MGDPRKLKNKYDTPIHPWEKLRLDAEKPLMKEYGLVNKKELWRISSKLKNFKDTAKKLVASKSEQAFIEKKQMIERMKSYGLISTDELDEILGLDIKQLLDRRLQTVVLKKGLARSVKQARQMITHRHISVNNTTITAPGYLVKVSDQESIDFVNDSRFNDESHPERALAETEEVKNVKSNKADSSKNVDKKDESETKDKKEDSVTEKSEKEDSKTEEIKEESQKDKKESKEDVSSKEEPKKEEKVENVKKESQEDKKESDKKD